MGQNIDDDVSEAGTDPTPEPSPSPSPNPAPHPWGRRLKWGVSLWLAYHVAGIIAAPASVSPSSELARSAWTLFQPYLQALHLNNGYHFFAPEPAQPVPELRRHA